MKKIFIWLLIIFYVSVSSPACIVSSKNDICLAGASNYRYWYGSAPTAAGMLLSWYDRKGYSNLMPDCEAETCTFDVTGAIVNNSIASSGHINDFYRAGYGHFKDDVFFPTHQPDCLADFMGTSQDWYGNVNGETKFFFFTDNSPTTPEKMLGLHWFRPFGDGMYGIGEYIKYRGYKTSALYNQLIYGYGGKSAGFTYEQYQAQIDSNCGVLIHLINEFTGFTQTVYGYGYNNLGDVLVYDTQGPYGQNPGFLKWGEYYFQGGQWLTQYGVTIVNLHPAPEPAPIVLMLTGFSFFVKIIKKKMKILKSDEEAAARQYFHRN
ncbi:MAG: hypothetical protein A2Y12_08220 [Planctomycetes bacterium GWF2_42_9]|nr:MAG: hypothetical protein A2Y12_08220 [Planctomycetes bacterium GWF2_42_9]